MNKKILVLLIVFVLGFISMPSCKKKNNNVSLMSSYVSLLQSTKWNAIAMLIATDTSPLNYGDFTAKFDSTQVTINIDNPETGNNSVTTKYTLSGNEIITEESIIPSNFINGQTLVIKKLTIQKLTSDSLIVNTSFPVNNPNTPGLTVNIPITIWFIK